MRTYRDFDTGFDAILKTTDGLIRQDRNYQVITPIIGGGVQAGQVDLQFPVNAKSVRGHLRYWWRATRGSMYESVQQMKAVEDAIFGSAAKFDEKGAIVGGQGAVKIEVIVTTPGIQRRPFQFYRDDRKGNQLKFKAANNVPPYAAFPLQPTSDDEKVANRERLTPQQADERFIRTMLDGVQFQVKLTYPTVSEHMNIAIKPELDAAFWAWETFGGIGARTRRGFGALVCTNFGTLPPSNNSDDVLDWFDDQIKALNISQDQLGDLTCVPAESRDCVILTQCSNAGDAWKKLIDGLRMFRSTQNEKMWPEPDNVRRLQGKEPRREPLPGSKGKDPAFPRSAFGLPIVYHFKDNEVADTMLVGKEHDRLSSSLVLKPLACKGNRYVGLATILRAPALPPGGLRLQGIRTEQPLRQELSDQEAEAIPVLKNNRDVLIAFLNFLDRQ